jgi:hypothetical protein
MHLLFMMLRTLYKRLDWVLIMAETADESTEHEQSHRQGWGGKRRGAGRRPRDVEKWIAARGLKPASAAEILERADERRIWYRLRTT